MVSTQPSRNLTARVEKRVDEHSITFDIVAITRQEESTEMHDASLKLAEVDILPMPLLSHHAFGMYVGYYFVLCCHIQGLQRPNCFH
jgi:hypothetical protein